MGEAGEMSGKRQFLEETWTRGTAGRDLCGNSLGRGYEQKRASCLVIVNNGPRSRTNASKVTETGERRRTTPPL
jgi:hypothetical protein